jgi:hypothetical protein
MLRGLGEAVHFLYNSSQALHTIESDIPLNPKPFQVYASTLVFLHILSGFINESPR